MLFFFDVLVDPKDLSPDELWDLAVKEGERVAELKEAGKIVAIYKVAGQRRIIGIFNMESHDELDRIVARLPLARYLEFEEILPVRVYEDMAADVKKRWQ